MISENEQIEARIFLTKEAEKKNWIEKCEHGYLGLSAELSELREKNQVSFEKIPIPSESDEESIWEVFSKVIEQLQEGDQVIFDITHSFRYQPMLALLILHFAKVAFRIEIQGIYYGNFESRVNGEIPTAPVTDLTSFIDLQDWVTNIYAFEASGRAEPLSRWINKEKGEKFKQGLSKQEESIMRKIGNFADELNRLSLELETNRGPTLRETAARVLEKINEMQADQLPGKFRPMAMLLNRIEEQVRQIAEPDPIESGLNAVLWCVEHGLIEQAYTMLDEILVTATCLIEGYSMEDAKDYKKIRKWIASFYNGMIEIRKPKFKNLNANKLTGEFSEKYSELIKLYGDLKNDRNDLNHAGWRKQPQQANEFIIKFSKVENERNRPKNAEKYLELIELIRQYWRENKPDHIG
jgi:CRISPR-associated Csx2 family protein